MRTTKLDKITIVVLLFTIGSIMMIAFGDIAVASAAADVTPLNESMIDTAFDRYFTILLFPVNNPAFVPSVMPLIAGLIVVAFYYGRYRNEELGWGAAVSNTLIMTTTGVILLYKIAPDAVTWKYLQTNLLAVASYLTGTSLADSGAEPRFMVAFGIIALGLVIITLDYYHLWPKHLAFFISSGFMVYTLAYLTIAIVYAKLPLNVGTGLSSLGAIYTSLLFVRTLKVMSNTQEHNESE